MDRIEGLREEVKGIFSGSPGSHDYEHTERVFNMCMHLCKVEGADAGITAAAALLHDIGRSRQDSTGGAIPHEEAGCEMAKPLLEKHGYDKSEVERILHCIRSHRFRKGPVPETIEAKVLYDADKLDAIGAVGVGRAFVFAGESGAAVHIPGLDPEKTSSYSREDTAYREFMVKLKHVRDRLHTDEGRRIAAGRHDFMVRFFKRLDEEAAGRV